MIWRLLKIYVILTNQSRSSLLKYWNTVPFLHEISCKLHNHLKCFSLNRKSCNFLYMYRHTYLIWVFLAQTCNCYLYIHTFFGAPRSIFYFSCTLSRSDGGNRTRNIAVHTWLLSLLSYDRHPYRYIINYKVCIYIYTYFISNNYICSWLTFYRTAVKKNRKSRAKEQ